jgi:hypothetical protein
MEIIEEKVLANGALLSIVDESKKIAGDRWCIKLRCLTTISWAEWMDQYVAEEADPYEVVRKSLEPITHEIVKERNFIAQSEKDQIIAEMLASLQDNVEHYLASPNFTKNCFLKHLQEWREAQKMMSMMKAEETSDGDEPADFSGCFR